MVASKPGELLTALMTHGIAHLTNGVYYVTKKSGEEPILGLVGEEDAIETFLKNHPEKEQW